jgi:aldehyde oxidoreductase
MLETRSSEHLVVNVNGESRALTTDPNRLLLDVLRDDLRLTGAKRACDNGECGSCTVLLNGRGVMSCLLPVSRVGTKAVVTIEGLATMPRDRLDAGQPQALSTELHPLQKAFITSGAAQCGFCIPGMILEAQALLSANPNPSREDISSRLSRNLCRCTGYTKIIDAIQSAAAEMRQELTAAPIVVSPPPPASRESLIGGRVPKADSEAHVTGRSLYAADLQLDGALQVRVLRSPHHHARIVSIDASRAERLPGVAAVLTSQNVPGPTEMLNARPQVHLFARDKVRFLGEAVAAVAAESESVATEALGLIAVEYEALNPVLDPVESMRSDAELIEPPYPNWIRVGTESRGDTERAFAESDVVVEGTYRTATREHAPMEPEAGIAYQDGDVLTIHAPHHHPFAAQRWIAALLGIPIESVRVICPAMGGNFGHRGDFLHSGLLALTVSVTGRPARIVYTREESLFGSSKAMAYVLKYKTGATKDGRLTALKAEVLANGGCWVAHPEVTARPSNIRHIGLFTPGPYEVPNATVDILETSTNQPRSNPMRGTNIPDLAFAWESQMDMIASRLGLDPLEFRLRNVIGAGSVTVNGVTLDESVGARATLEALRAPYALAQERRQSEPPESPWHRGIGVACIWQSNGGGRGEEGGGGWHGLKLGPAGGAAELLADGRVRVLSGVVEKGQGIAIALAQIAAQELGLPLDAIEMVYGDTHLAPYPIGTSGQRTLFHAGGAVQQACLALKQALLEVSCRWLDRPAKNVVLENGVAFADDNPTNPVSFASLAKRMDDEGIKRYYEAWFRFEKSEEFQGPVFGYASQLTELDVNVETGAVRVRNVTYAADVGKVINRQSLEGQVDGGVLMGLSYALKEAFVPGETGSLKDYGLPGIKDSPDLVTGLLLEDPVVGAPFGAKGAAEMTASAGMASVANAIADAVGARVYELPARPARVRDAIRVSRIL